MYPLISINLDDMDSPVSRNYGHLFEAQLSENYTTILPLSIVKIELSLEDDIIGVSPFSKDISMNDFDARMASPSLDFNDKGKILIYVSNNSHYVYQAKRKVLNLFEIFGTVGGIFQIFDVFFGIILGYLSTYNFKRELKREIVNSENELDKLRLKIKNIEKRLNDANLQNNDEEAKDQPRQNSNLFNFSSNPIRESTPKVDSTQNVLKGFNKDLDCIDIVYSIKTIRAQVDYLPRKDGEYFKPVQENIEESQEMYRRNLRSLSKSVVAPVNNSAVSDELVAPNLLSHHPNLNTPHSKDFFSNIEMSSPLGKKIRGSTKLVKNKLQKQNTLKVTSRVLKYKAPEESELVQMISKTPIDDNNL